MGKIEKETAYIYLDNGQEIKIEYPESCFDEIFNELLQSMNSGSVLALDASYEFSMYDSAEHYLSGLNGKKIVGYNF